MQIRKILAAALAVALVAALSVCGTLAYLTHQTEEVKNTFTVGSIFPPEGGITLLESEPIKQDDGSYILGDTKVQAADYEDVIPGSDLPKDPTVTVEDLTANAYVFVKIVDNTTEALTYTVDPVWTKLNVTVAEGESIYAAPMLTGSTEGADWSSSILAGDTVSVAADAEGDLGTLSFLAYICQAQGFADAAAAWNACFGNAA